MTMSKGKQLGALFLMAMGVVAWGWFQFGGAGPAPSVSGNPGAPMPVSAQAPQPAATGNMTPEQLENTGWWMKAQEYIRKSEYQIVPVKDKKSDEFQAFNRGQNLQGRFSAEGARIVPANGKSTNWDIQWKFAGFGRMGALKKPLECKPAHANTRVSFDRKGIQEWYENSADGIEQGFIVSERLAGDGLLTVEGEFAGSLRPVAAQRGGGIDFLTAEDERVLQYTNIKAADADGRPLEAHIQLAGNKAQLRIRDDGATYPLQIDPLFASPASADGMVYSTDNSQSFGYAVDVAADLYGDGMGAIIVGAPKYGGTGAVFIFRGSSSGALNKSMVQADARLLGNQPGGLFGCGVACAGDLNGDGFKDIIVGASSSSTDATNLPNEGCVFVYYGGPAGITTNQAPGAVLHSNSAHASFGSSVAFAGDFNGDNFSDIIVGAPTYVPPSGPGSGAFIFLGSAAGLAGRQPGDPGVISIEAAGSSVFTAGDVNGDGYADVIVNTNSQSTAGQSDLFTSYVFLGSQTPPARFNIADAHASMSLVVGGYPIGDVNGDGYSDIAFASLVGSPFSVTVYEGSPTGLDLVGPASTTITVPQMTGPLSGADINGDGYADLVVAPFMGGDGYIFLGSPDGIVASIVSNAAVDLKAYSSLSTISTFSVAVGDINGDGYADVILGDSGYNIGCSGAAFVFLGGHTHLQTSELVWARPSFQQAQAELGGVVAAAGDVDGDGYADVIVGSSLGSAFLFKGGPNGLDSSVPVKLSADPGAGTFGKIVAGAGDVNGDGLADVMVAGPGNDAVTIFLGSKDMFTQDHAVGDSGVVTVHAGMGSASGVAMAAAGDVNGDGYGDIVVGAQAAYGGSGAAYIFKGSSSGIHDANPGSDFQILIGRPNDGFGCSVAGIGDINGDGYADIAVGSMANYAAAFLGYHDGIRGNGPASADAFLIVCDEQPAALFGSSVAGADVNGDGYSDLIVGAPQYAAQAPCFGAVFVFNGSPAGLQANKSAGASAVILSHDITGFGASVAAAGDVNGDGYADVLVQGGTHSPPTYLFYGSPSGLVMGSPDMADALLIPSKTIASKGEGNCAGVGDVNGDGLADIVVGDSSYNSNVGCIYVFLGGGGKRPLQTQQAKDSPPSPLAVPGGMIGSDAIVQISQIGQSPAGPLKVGLEVEIKPYEAHFDGLGTSILWNSGEAMPGWNSGEDMAGALLVSQYANGFHWRARTLYNPVQYPWQRNGPWTRPAWATPGPADFRLADGYLPPTDPGGLAISWPSSPNPPTTTDALTCTVMDASVSPGAVPQNPIVYQYTWTNDKGTSIVHDFSLPTSANTYDTLASSYTKKHETWTCAVQAQDAQGGLSHLSPSITFPEIVDTPPTAPAVVFASPAKQDPLAAQGFVTSAQNNILGQITTQSDDPDVADGTDGVLYSWRWATSPGFGTLIAQGGPGTDLANTLPREKFSPGDRVYCQVTATDNEGASANSVPLVCRVNRPPNKGMQVAISPLKATTSDPIICSVTTPVTDPDGDPVLYTYEWACLARPGVSWTSTTNVPASTLPATIINEGDAWKCTVTSTDGIDAGESVSTDVVPILRQSTITCNVSPSSITLGQYLTVSGAIDVKGPALTTVSFTSMTPDGNAEPDFPPAVSITANAYSQDLFLPDQASEGRAPWTVQAAWPGDGTALAASSAPVAFTVMKAQPAVTLALSQSAVPKNFTNLTASANLNALLPDQLRNRLLNDQTINLYIHYPDGSSPTPPGNPVMAETAIVQNKCVAEFSANAFSAHNPAIALDKPGVWQFIAQFPGNANFSSASSPAGDTNPSTVRLTVKDKAGYAIIIVGRLDNGTEGLQEHIQTGDFIYHAFAERGIGLAENGGADDDVYYIRDLLPANAPGNMHQLSKNELQNAVTQWAVTKMNATPAPLYVVMVDHGGVDQFYTFSGTFDATRIVTPTDLRGWLQTLEAQLTPAAKAAGEVIIYGACHSGSFIDKLSFVDQSSGLYRVLIASCAADEVSHRGVVDPVTNVRDGEAFLSDFFRKASEGKTLKDAFESATTDLDAYIGTNSNAGVAETTQHPLLDDNGDSQGTQAGALSFQAGQDGARAYQITMGYGFNAGDDIAAWLAVTSTLFLGNTDPVPPLIALMNRDIKLPDPNCHAADCQPDFAWIEVKSPAYAGSTSVDAADPNAQMAVELTTYPSTSAAGSMFTWDANTPTLGASPNTATLATAFSAPGTYEVYYYVTDGKTGQTSSSMQTTVYRASANNHPPNAATLVSPADGATANTQSVFTWNDATDPDGDVVTYLTQWAGDANFTNPTTVATAQTYAQGQGLIDGQAYYWRVVAVDPYGAQTPSDYRVVHFDNTNATLDNTIIGVITDAATKTPLPGCKVTLNTIPPLQVQSQSRGDFTIDGVSDGTYSITVALTGYQSATNSSVVASGGQLAPVYFALAKTGGFVWGDVTGDGKSDMLDASDLQRYMVSTCGPGAFVLPVAPDMCYNALGAGGITREFPPCADVDGDGKLTANDVTEILKKRVGLISYFPADTNKDGFGPEAGAKTTPGAKAASVGWHLSIPSITASPGDTVSVPINVDDATGITGYYVYLQYDQNMLTCTGYDMGSLTGAWGPTVNYQGSPGVVLATDEATDAIAGPGSLLVLKFQVAATAPLGAVGDIKWIDAHENDGQKPTLTDGTVTVTGVDLTLAYTGQGTVALNPPGGTYIVGTDVALTASPAADWLFDHWEGAITGNNNPALVTMDNAKAVIAVFVHQQHSLTINGYLPNQGAVTPASGLYDADSIVTLTASAASGWHFVGWSGSIATSVNPIAVTMDADKTITATFVQPVTLTVTATPSDEGFVTLNPPGGVYDPGTNVTLSCTAAGGWHFDHWENALTTTNNPETIGMDSSKVVTAVFAQNPAQTCTLNLSYQGNGAVGLSPSPTGGVYAVGTVVTLTPEPDAGWHFDHWGSALSGNATPATITMNADQTVLAVFAQDTYNLTSTVTGHGSVTMNPPGGIYANGTTVNVTASSASGWHFDHWEGALTGIANPASIVITGQQSLNAVFVQNTLTLALSVTGKGSVTLDPPGGAYIVGTSVTLTPTPDDGWRFDRWEGTLSGTANPAQVVMNANQTIAAIFVQIIQYSIAVNVTGNGAVALNPPGGTYDAGTSVTLTVTPAAGWHFDHWEGALTGSDNPTTVVLNDNQNVNAIFVADVRYSLSVNVSGNGSVTMDPPGGIYDAGATVTLTPVPASGMKFDHWEGALSGGTTPASVTMDANKTVTAVFTATSSGIFGCFGN